jgi:hypothetical protein
MLMGSTITWPSAKVSEALASNGFLGSVSPLEPSPKSSDSMSGCIFSCQQQKMSLAQTGIYNRHVEAALEADEDFFDNMS